MTKLKSITLSNVRRFGKDTKFELGDSATIIIAPNGTGKTSIFEAIELALTGSIRRLENLSTFIRDKQQEAHVGLVFSCGSYADVKILHDHDPQISGDLTRIIGQVELSDLPYLLRLTHMLDQRGGDWFVQSDNNTAGEQLNKLPIGRDAANANKAMNGAKRAAKAIEKDIQRDLVDSQEKLNHWVKLLQKRQLSQNVFNHPLIPLDELVIKLNQCAEGLNFSHRITDAQLTSIKDFTVRLDSTVDSNESSINKKKLSLLEIAPLIKDFPITNAQCVTAQKVKEKLQEVLTLTREKLEKEKAKEVNGNDRYRKLTTEFYSLGEIKRKVDARNTLNIEIQLLNQADLKLANDITLTEQQLAKAKQELEISCQLVNKYKSLREDHELLDNDERSVTQAKGDLFKWQSARDSLERLYSELKSSKSKIDITSEQLKLTIEKQAKSNKDLEEGQLNLEHLSRASDSIRSAISIIASELPSDQNECPLCGVLHGFEELSKRISFALEKIDPTLTRASERVVELRSACDSVAKEVILLNEKLTISKNNNENLEGEIKELELLIDSIAANGIRSANLKIEDVLFKKSLQESNFEEAKSILIKASEKIQERRNRLASDFDISPEPSETDLQNYKHTLEAKESELRSIQTKKAETNELIKYKSKQLEGIILTEEDVLSVSNIGALEENIAKEQEILSSIKYELEIIQSDFDNAEQEMQRNQKHLDLLVYKVNDSKAKWLSIGMLEEPSLAALEASLAVLEENLTDTGSIRVELNKIRLESARWDATEEFQKVQKELNDIRGEVDEETYLYNLSASTKSIESKLANINTKVKTLESFSEALSIELTNVDGRIKAIEPVWQSLLNRIVLDPRYSNTGLDISKRYNKPTANITAPLHDSKVSVSTLASEAQITDLQLTFLMAMAQQQRWSPWRALLLDDPTQHHDLVHSSSVFDLLRDYIVEQDFQLLLTTHDTVQANFLKRKLMNDGIPVKICRLEPTEHGVDVNSQQN